LKCQFFIGNEQFRRSLFFLVVLKGKLFIGNEQFRRPLFFLVVLKSKLFIGNKQFRRPLFFLIVLAARSSAVKSFMSAALIKEDFAIELLSSFSK